MDSYTEKPWLSYRNDIIDFLNLRKDQNPACAIFEADITKATQIITKHKDRNPSNSTLAYLLWCYAQAIKKHPEMQAIKKGKKLILFDDVDITMIFEKTLPNGEKAPVPHIFRSVQNKSYADIKAEILSLKDKDLSEINKRKKSRFFKVLPAFLRMSILKMALKDPVRRKQALGTVAFTTLGLTVRNRKFWPVPIGPYPCSIAAGSSVIDKGIQGDKNIWCLTISFDHNMNDGAPAVRFGQTFINLLESGEGLL